MSTTRRIVFTQEKPTTTHSNEVYSKALNTEPDVSVSSSRKSFIHIFKSNINKKLNEDPVEKKINKA